ncbi:hypothetical protein FACS1894125_4640 [Actinomycetota bacterium]|nr:hypothetical protein FACS1894125_4640 [Actinomycetota bacterium]
MIKDEYNPHPNLEKIRHPSQHTIEHLAPGTEASGLMPDDLKDQIPALHRPKDKGTLLFDIPGPKGRKRMRILNAVGGLALLAIVGYVLSVLGQNGQLEPQLWQDAFSWDAFEYYYVPGFISTLVASLVSIVGAVIFGFIFGILRLSQPLVVRGGAGVIVEFTRAVPVLLMMIFFWRAFSFAGVGETSAFWAVCIALTLYNGSIIAELVRSGVGNLPKGQHEAAVAAGLTHTQSLKYVELPQAIRSMVPAIVTQLAVVVKDTALGAMIVYLDLLQEARRLGSAHSNILQTMIIATVIYFIVCYFISRQVEKRTG